MAGGSLRDDPGAFWNERFAAPGYRYGTAPNQFLAQSLPGLAPKPGLRLLLPADGEGRNGVFVAQQGHQAVIVDISTKAREKALALAAERGVALDYTIGDLSAWEPDPASADGVVIVFMHLPPDLRTSLFARLLTALKPGGFLLLECFREEQLARGTGGPPNADWLYSRDTLRPLVQGLDITLLEEAEPTLDEGPGHQGPGDTLRLIAHKPS